MKRFPIALVCGLVLAACASDPAGSAVNAESVTASSDGQPTAQDSAGSASLGGHAMGSGN